MPSLILFLLYLYKSALVTDESIPPVDSVQLDGETLSDVVITLASE